MTRQGSAGKAVGMLLFGSLSLVVLTLVMGAAFVTRSFRERALERNSIPVSGRIDHCAIAVLQSGGSSRGHELRCRSDYVVDQRPYTTRVMAGHPKSRKSYDAWLLAHPAGSMVTLRRATSDPTSISGFDRELVLKRRRQAAG